MKIAILGLGKFEMNVANELYARGHDVLVIDKTDSLAQKGQQFSSKSVVTDCTETDPSIDPSIGKRFADRNYIIISKHFCTVSARLGFHFSTLEAYLGVKKIRIISPLYVREEAPMRGQKDAGLLLSQGSLSRLISGWNAEARLFLRVLRPQTKLLGGTPKGPRTYNCPYSADGHGHVQ